MGLLLEDLYDHEGYADRRLPDGRLASGVWTSTREFTAWVAACGCGWHATRDWPPTEAGEELAVDQWRHEHGEPELGRRAERRRDQLARTLEWLGTQGDRLEDPAAVDRVGRALDRAGGLVADVRRDLERQAPEREADHER
jgi:hypothetical protein